MSHTIASQRELPVESLIYIEQATPPRWAGKVRLPDDQRILDLLIFQHQQEFWAIGARCLHEGIDLSYCPLREDRKLLCPAHGLQVDLKATGIRVKQKNGHFFVKLYDVLVFSMAGGTPVIAPPAHESETTEQLRAEIDKLRLANLKQEKQILVITHSMDAMLKDSEQQKHKLKQQANQHQRLTRFVDRIMDTLDVLLFVIDTQGLIQRLNTAVEKELNIPESDLLGTGIDVLLPLLEQRQLAQQLPILPWTINSVLLETIKLSGYYTGEHELQGHDKSKPAAYFWLKSSLLHSEQGKLEGAVVTALNITALKDRETRLRLSGKVIESSREAIFICDPNGAILEVNEAFCNITEYQRLEVLGQNARILKARSHNKAFYENLKHALLSRGFWKGEIWIRRKYNGVCPMLLSVNAVLDEKGQLTHYAAISTDISQQKQTQQELTQLAYFDVLTRLPNRFLFKDRFEQELHLAQRNHTRLALFFLDLDNFKNINDTLGHWAGDNLLQIIATRIQNCLRKSDTVARLGGDEFTIILPGLNNINDASELARQLVHALSQPVAIEDHTVYIGASIGIAIYPNDGTDFHTLTKHADTAMYAAKAKGRGIFQYFESGMNDAAHQRMLLETALRLAIEQEEFQLYYQPKSDCSLSKITGAEALICWRRAGFGIIPPDSFISIAEETSLIIPLGFWIVKTACLQANAWGDLLPNFRIAINLSPRQLMADNFIRELDLILAETKTNTRWIEFEITETLVMHDMEKATTVLHEIRNRGIHISMDDFGTGYSSLSYLQKLPIQSLKIDKSFIQAYDGQPSSSEAAFIKTIVSLGQVLNMTVIAEGVETAAQLALLAEFGCHQMQGFYLSPPVSAEEFHRSWLQGNRL